MLIDIYTQHTAYFFPPQTPLSAHPPLNINIIINIIIIIISAENVKQAQSPYTGPDSRRRLALRFARLALLPAISIIADNTQIQLHTRP